MLCHFADRFPGVVADFLERSRNLGRRFREDSVTDLMMANLVILGGSRVIVEFPNEPVTGADMQWDFVNRDDHTFYRLLIQAKRLYCDGNDWRQHNYRHLRHKVGSGFQADLLCHTAYNASVAGTPTYPLYIFYNPQSTCQSAAGDGYDDVRGVNVADGYDVRDLAIRRNRRLSALLTLFHPLSLLFCPSPFFAVQFFNFVARTVYLTMGVDASGRMSLGFEMPPRPIDIHDRLRVIRGADDTKMPRYRPSPFGQEASRPPDLPPVATSIPDDVQVRIDRVRSAAPFDEAVLPLDRWRVTFISSNPRPSEEGLRPPPPR